jgi:hypothetical protein
MERLARNISLPDFLDQLGPCWPWTGRVTLVTETMRPHVSRRRRQMWMAIERSSPVIEVNGRRQSPARLMYELVTQTELPAKFTLRRNKRLCADRLCINPHHRLGPGAQRPLAAPPEEAPRQLEYNAAPDDVGELIELLHDYKSRHSSIAELREAMHCDYELYHYEQAFEREPDLKRDLIREGSNP